jgi:hypothetical protein
VAVTENHPNLDIDKVNTDGIFNSQAARSSIHEVPTPGLSKQGSFRRHAFGFALKWGSGISVLISLPLTTAREIDACLIFAVTESFYSSTRWEGKEP